MGVPGCPNCYADPWMKDIGFFSTAAVSSWWLSGKDGARIDREIACDLTNEQALVLAGKIIALCRKKAKKMSALQERSIGSVLIRSYWW